jgi:hypothetical protein
MPRSLLSPFSFHAYSQASSIVRVDHPIQALPLHRTIRLSTNFTITTAVRGPTGPGHSAARTRVSHFQTKEKSLQDEQNGGPSYSHGHTRKSPRPHSPLHCAAAQSTRSQQPEPANLSSSLSPPHESSNQSHPLLNPTPDTPTASPLLARDLRLVGASRSTLVFLGAESRGRFAQIWVRVRFLRAQNGVFMRELLRCGWEAGSWG